MEAVCCGCRVWYLKSSFFKAGRDSVFGNQSSFLDFCPFLLSGPQKVDDFLLEVLYMVLLCRECHEYVVVLYIGIRAEFINSALWRRSVGGVVASILLFIRWLPYFSLFLLLSSLLFFLGRFRDACRFQAFRSLFGSGHVLFPVRCLCTGL